MTRHFYDDLETIGLGTEHNPKEPSWHSGGGMAPLNSPLPRVPSVSEMSDGWVDAGTESDGSNDWQEAGADTQPVSVHASSSNLQPSQSSGVTALLPQTTAAPGSQFSNNPFLRQRCNEGEVPQKEVDNQEHAQVCAELKPDEQISTPENKGISSSTSPDPQVQFHGQLNSRQQPDSKGKGVEIAQPVIETVNHPQDNSIEDHQQAASSFTASKSSNVPHPPPQNETYQIKHIRWLDYSSGDNVRTTPILMQNLNGPCPLLALVNALTMSTPPQLETTLTETLRMREQVSLRLLLDAVVDELISNRLSAQAEIPDMAELYDFLLALHTGLNVNPAFVAAEEVPTLIDFGPESPSIANNKKFPGGFENTKEMRLYSTFGIPLIHGWLPPPAHPVYAALNRSAKTHEDAENLLTMEDYLEQKLSSQGLTEDEQRLLQDVGDIKFFLESSATQLTGYGLDTICETMAGGSFAIFFRNNHFSTLYKNPASGHVFSLVTDQGYGKYDEIVWESLVDVNGAGAELFSGDFRIVSHSSDSTSQAQNALASDYNGKGWQTVNRGGKHKVDRKPVASMEAAFETGEPSASASSKNVQEDADLALALQLQEEEEERHRREAAVQRGPDLSSQGQGGARLQKHHRRPSQPQQQQHVRQFTTPSPRLVLRPNPSPSAGLWVNDSASSSASNFERPLRGPQQNNSPFPSNNRGMRRPGPSNTVRPRDPEGPSEEPPPPTYESALEDEPYEPPEASEHHPASPLPGTGPPEIFSPPSAPPQGTPFNVNEAMVYAEGQVPSQQRQRLSAGGWNGVGPDGRGVVRASPMAQDFSRRRRFSNNPWPTQRADKDNRECVVM